MDAALVELVEDHEADPLQRRVGLESASEYSLSDDLYPRGAGYRRLVSYPEPDCATDPLAEQCGHVTRRGSGGETARLQKENSLSAEPRFIHQRQGDTRGLPCSGGGLQDGSPALGERLPKARQHLFDWEKGNSGHGKTISPVWNLDHADDVVRVDWHAVCTRQDDHPESIGRRERR